MRMGLRLLAVLIVVFAVSGCGFQPLYGGAGYRTLSGVNVASGPSRFDYHLADSLRDFVGPASGAAGQLDIVTRLTDTPVGLSPTGQALRVRLSAEAGYVFTPPSGEHTRGRVERTMAFDSPSSDPYAIIVARSEAEERLAQVLAEDIVQALAVETR